MRIEIMTLFLCFFFRLMCDEVVFLHHGLWAYPTDLVNVATLLREELGCECHLLACNVGMTSQGIQACGQRALSAILAITDTLPPGTLVSFFGHSLGGLILLQAINFLVAETPGYFTSRGLICQTFFAAASPLLGVNRPTEWFASRVVTWFADRMRGRTFQDLMFKNGDMEALASDSLLAQLKNFRQLILFGNTIEDAAVTPISALLLSDDPLDVPDFETLFIQLDDTKLRPWTPSQGVMGKLRARWRSLPWQRFAFKIEREWFDLVGNAHNKIVMHARRDIFKRGGPALAQIVKVWNSPQLTITPSN
jgi:hypothetical protein